MYKDPDLSAEYITRLAKCYRYILDKNLENLISVEAELEFLESYIFLMQVRYQDHIVFDIDITESVKQQGLIPPATLRLILQLAPAAGSDSGYIVSRDRVNNFKNWLQGRISGE